MGRILSSVRKDDKIRLDVEIDYDEATLLHGHFDDVHVFTERVAEFKTDISSRGKNSCTKYFLVPRHLRSNLDYKCPVNCQKIEMKDRIIFIYVVDKIQPCARSKMGEFSRGEADAVQ